MKALKEDGRSLNLQRLSFILENKYFLGIWKHICPPPPPRCTPPQKKKKENNLNDFAFNLWHQKMLNQLEGGQILVLSGGFKDNKRVVTITREGV